MSRASERTKRVVERLDLVGEVRCLVQACSEWVPIGSIAWRHR